MTMRILLEATGGFETLAVAGLSSAGLTVLFVNPSQVPAYANAISHIAKTDPIDAAVISAFVLATKPEVRSLRSAETQVLSEFVAVGVVRKSPVWQVRGTDNGTHPVGRTA